MASFPLNRKEFQFIKEVEKGLLSFYKDPWMELDEAESLKALKILTNAKSRPENSLHLEAINSLFRKISE